MEFNALIPELSVSDINKSKDFYLSLGFEIKYERPENKFVFLQLEDNQIMIEQINGNWSVGEMHYPFGNGINLSMRVSDVEAKYNELKPDLVTLDITMPNKDGIQALKEIKAADPNATCVMCSAMGQQSMVIDAIQSGAKDFIVKPFQADRVLESIRKVLS